MAALAIELILKKRAKLMMQRLLFLISILLAASAFAGDEDIGSSTVIGPRNPDLFNGANLIKAGNASGDLEMIRRGSELTVIGLGYAQGGGEEEKGLSNLCAAYILLHEVDKAIHYCDLAIERNDMNWHAYSNRALANVFKKDYEAVERDLERGFELNPDSSMLRRVRAYYLDVIQPVEPEVTVDDRAPIHDAPPAN